MNTRLCVCFQCVCVCGRCHENVLCVATPPRVCVSEYGKYRTGRFDVCTGVFPHFCPTTNWNTQVFDRFRHRVRRCRCTITTYRIRVRHYSTSPTMRRTQQAHIGPEMFHQCACGRHVCVFAVGIVCRLRVACTHSIRISNRYLIHVYLIDAYLYLCARLPVPSSVCHLMRRLCDDASVV